MAAKKGIGSFLKAQASSKIKATTEEELKVKGVQNITPDDVLGLSKPTKTFLCSLADNVFAIEFVGFKLRDMESNTVLVETEKPEGAPSPSPSDDDSVRQITYEFSQEFLRLKTVGATIKFTVGDQPVKGFRMIERHFFKDRLIKSFDFDFGFCIPNSVNTREDIYELPALSDDEVAEMVTARFETRSDSFYFADGKLIMHNKASYAYE